MSEPAESIARTGRIVGRYVLHDEIASGGMASVHLGRLVGPGGFARTIAIKRLHPQLAKDPEFATKFHEEARLAARVQHPNVVSVIDVVTVADEVFLVMEYVQGDSLSRLLKAARKNGETIPLGIGLTIVADALAGLHAAHETLGENGVPLRIVHRDVSPQNIMVGADGVARVLDFGVAKAASHATTQSDGIKGKIAYMAPEQFTRAPLDRRTDVFAASIVLWEVLTGKRLFGGEEPAGIVNRVLNEELEPPSAHVPGLAPELDAIVMRGLQRNPEDRFASAHEMAAAIEATKLLTRPAEIGAWVRKCAADTLRMRSERIAQIEGEPPSSSGMVRVGHLVPAIVGDPTVTLHSAQGGVAVATPQTVAVTPVETAIPSQGVALATDAAAESPKSRRKAVVALAALAFVLVASVAFGFTTLRTKTEPAAGAPPAAPPVSASVAPPEPSASSPPPLAPIASAPAAPEKQPTHNAVRSKKRADCSPPYYFDENKVKRFKPQCI